jgi:hypothetical protein
MHLSHKRIFHDRILIYPLNVDIFLAILLFVLTDSELVAIRRVEGKNKRAIKGESEISMSMKWNSGKTAFNRNPKNPKAKEP